VQGQAAEPRTKQAGVTLTPTEVTAPSGEGRLKSAQAKRFAVFKTPSSRKTGLRARTPRAHVDFIRAFDYDVACVIDRLKVRKAEQELSWTKAALREREQQLKRAQQKLSWLNEALARLRQELDRRRGTGVECLEVQALEEQRGELQEGLRRVTDAMLRHEAEQLVLAQGNSCMCPISHALMREPVVAETGIPTRESRLKSGSSSRESESSSPRPTSVWHTPCSFPTTRSNL
jgi:hypothetical protein